MIRYTRFDHTRRQMLFRIFKFTKHLVNKGGTGFTTSCWNSYFWKKSMCYKEIKIFLILGPFFIWSKSMLKSPVIIKWELLFETFEIIGASS